MKIFTFLLFLSAFAFNISFAQESWLGVPLLDKNIRLSKCPICKKINDDKALELFDDSLKVNRPIQKWKNPEYFDKNSAYLKSMLSKYKNDQNKYDIILHSFFSIYSLKKLNNYEELNPENLSEFSSFFDTLITRSSNAADKLYFHQRRMNEFQSVGALDKINENTEEQELDQKDVSWFINDDLAGIDKKWLNIAKIYVDDHKNAGAYHLYDSYNGLNLGYTSFATLNGFYQGIDVSFDNTFEINPLTTLSPRISWLGSSFLKEIKGDNSEFLLYVVQVRGLLQLNLAQFGVNNNRNLSTNTWFWKPEIGVNLGMLNIAYAYNLPFKNLGDDIQGNQLKISFSYPLVRLGKYM